MSYLPLSFLAGMLTVLAPCVLPLLPVIIGGSLTTHRVWRPLVMNVSLGLSIVVFTLLLKVSTALITISPATWALISGSIIAFFGLVTLFPEMWEHTSSRLRLGQQSQALLHKASQKKNLWGTVLMGACLGPIFASCSPVYFVILGTVLPQSFFVGLLNLLVYAFGLSLILFAIAFLGQRAVARLRWAAHPKGWFKKSLGILFIFVGIAIIQGWDKQLEAWVLEQGFFDVTKIEQQLLKK